jgi:DNA-binding NtrC family response regulator
MKVLIVDDDNAMAQMCAKLIRRQGYSAVIAGSCQDALTIIRSAGDVDVVISDVNMPQMSGLEFLARARQIDSHLPIILMTGYASVPDASERVAPGAMDCLLKPFDAQTLLGCLERAIRARRSRQLQH